MNEIQSLDHMPACGFFAARTVASWLGVSQVTVWRWVKTGRLPAPKKLGANTTRFNVGEVRSALAVLTQLAA